MKLTVKRLLGGCLVIWVAAFLLVTHGCHPVTAKNNVAQSQQK